MKTVLVVGSCGYLGSALVPALRRRDYNVVGVDALLWGQRPDPDTVVMDASRPDFQGFVQDTRPDAIVYLGAVAHDPAGEIAHGTQWNHTYFGPTNLAYAFKGTPFVFASSMSSFQPESGLYPAYKRLAEEDLLHLDNAFVLRFGTLFGGVEPIERYRHHLLLNSMVYGAARGKIIVRGGSQRRPVCSVNRAVWAFIDAIESFDNRSYTFFPGRTARNVYNTCGTVRQFGEYVSRFVGGCPIEVELPGGSADTRDYGWGGFNDDLLRSPLENLVAWTNQHLNEIRPEPRKLVAA